MASRRRKVNIIIGVISGVASTGVAARQAWRRQ